MENRSKEIETLDLGVEVEIESKPLEWLPDYKTTKRPESYTAFAGFKSYRVYLSDGWNVVTNGVTLGRDTSLSGAMKLAQEHYDKLFSSIIQSHTKIALTYELGGQKVRKVIKE